MRSLVAALAVLISFSVTAFAAFEPDMNSVCAPTPVTADSGSRVVPEKFIWALFLANKLTPISLGIRASDGYLDEMYAAVLARDYCGSHACEKGARDNLINAKEDLQRFLETHGRRPKGKGYFVSPPLTAENLHAVMVSFLRGRVDVRALCIGKKVENEAKPPEKSKVSLLDRVRLRKSPTDLGVAQRTSSGKINPAFKKVAPAKFTASRDYLAHKSTFNIDATLGYAFGPFQFSKESPAYGEIVPYFRFSRQSVQSDDPNAADVRNIAGGVVSNFFLEGIGGHFVQVEYYPEYLHSNRTGANVLSQNLVVTPDLPLPGFGGPEPLYPDAPVSVAASLQLIGTYVNVMNDGGDTALRDSNQVERIGPKAQIWLYGDEKPFEGWSFTASYEFLKATRGPLYALRRFETTLSYALPDSPFWSVNLDYVNGRNLQTLEEQQQITLGLGLKY